MTTSGRPLLVLCRTCPMDFCCILHCTHAGQSTIAATSFLDAELTAQLLDFSLQQSEVITAGTFSNLRAVLLLSFSIGVVTTRLEPCLQMSPHRWTANRRTRPLAHKKQALLMFVATKSRTAEK